MKSLTYYFLIKRKILARFQIYVSESGTSAERKQFHGLQKNDRNKEVTKNHIYIYIYIYIFIYIIKEVYI